MLIIKFIVLVIVIQRQYFYVTIAAMSNMLLLNKKNKSFLNFHFCFFLNKCVILQVGKFYSNLKSDMKSTKSILQ